MVRRPKVGSVVLIKHDGTPTEWTVKRTGNDDGTHLREIFELAKTLCELELKEGGTLKLLDANSVLIEEHRQQ